MGDFIALRGVEFAIRRQYDLIEPVDIDEEQFFSLMRGKETAEVRKPLSAETYGIVDLVVFLDLKEGDDGNQILSVKDRVVTEVTVQDQISVVRFISVADMTVSGFGYMRVGKGDTAGFQGREDPGKILGKISGSFLVGQFFTFVADRMVGWNGRHGDATTSI